MVFAELAPRWQLFHVASATQKNKQRCQYTTLVDLEEKEKEKKRRKEREREVKDSVTYLELQAT